MTMITFGGEELELRPSGTIYWPAHKIMVVSDLHLEKGSSYAPRGFFLPPYDTHDTLMRLLGDLEQRVPDLLILLGDSFHDGRALERLNERDARLLEKIAAGQRTVWIAGNHDPCVTDAAGEYHHPPIMFRHEAGEGEAHEISGHFHPVASINHKGHKAGGRCFVVTSRRIVMPSFGSYTGGLDVFSRPLNTVLGSEFDVHICTKDRVFGLKSSLFQK